MVEWKKLFFKEKAKPSCPISFKGGNVSDSKFDAGQLSAGMKVEKEHTNNPEITKQIAKGHLLEDANYYRKLKKMESGDSADTKLFS